MVRVFRKTQKLNYIWFPAEPSVVKHGPAERRAGGKGAALAAAQRTLASEHRSAIGDPTADGAVGTRCRASRWWVPELHDFSAKTKFGKSSNTHLFFNVR